MKKRTGKLVKIEGKWRGFGGKREGNRSHFTSRDVAVHSDRRHQREAGLLRRAERVAEAGEVAVGVDDPDAGDREAQEEGLRRGDRDTRL